VKVDNLAVIDAAAGDGIRAYTYGIGNVTVNDTAGTITTQSSPVQGFGNGIGAYNYGPGIISVTTAAGTDINSVGSGILANNFDLTATDSQVSVVSHGTITSQGTILTGSGSPAAGILAGFNGNNSPELGAHGNNVSIDDFGNVTGFGAGPTGMGTDGIRGFNYGDGSVTITVEATAVVDGTRFGVGAIGHNGGNVSVTNYGSVTGNTDAIDAITTGSGTATIDNWGQLFGNVAAYDATFTNHDVWYINGSSAFTGASTLVNDGYIISTGTSEISGLSSFTNTAGYIDVESGTLKIDAPVTGGQPCISAAARWNSAPLPVRPSFF
jgi:hypothetical protein